MDSSFDSCITWGIQAATESCVWPTTGAAGSMHAVKMAASEAAASAEAKRTSDRTLSL
jgi:hypothetical protein